MPDVRLYSRAMAESSSQQSTPDSGSPLVSVIIPCYNQAHFLGDAIQSCLAQTYSNLEVVVVNDGSPDNTSEVARAYGERVRLVEQENAGLSAARNTAIMNARGEFIVLLDADDRLLPDCVEARLKMISASSRIGAAIGAWWQTYEDGSRRLFGDRPRPGGVLGARDYIRGSVAPPCGMLIRKRAFVECGWYDPFLKSFEDWDMMMRISLKWTIAYETTPRSEWRQVSGSMSRNFLRMYDNMAAVIKKNRAYSASKSQYWKDTLIAKWFCVIGLAGQFYNENPFGVALKRIAELGWKRPSSIPYLLVYVLFVAPGRFLRRKRNAGRAGVVKAG